MMKKQEVLLKKYEALDQQNLVKVSKMNALHDGSDTN